MRPHSLHLSGFVGIKAAMALDQVTIDCNHLGDGLIAVVGPNGSGKTTVLDNLHPYLTMPSRATSGGGFSYFDHLVGGCGQKILEFSVGNQRYKSDVTWKTSGKTKKTEAYLFVERANGDWSPARNDAGFASDGKVTTYEAVTDSLIGPASLFFTAIHQAQGRRSLNTYSNAEIKALMAQLLKVERLREIAAKANEVCKCLLAAAAPLRAEIAQTLSSAQRQLPALVTRLALFKADLVRIDAQTAAIVTSREALAVEIATARSQQAQQEQLQREIAEMHVELKTCDDELVAANKEAIATADAAERAHSSVVKARQSDLQQVLADIASADRAIGSAQATLSKRDAAERAQGQLVAAELNQKTAEEALAKANAAAQQWSNTNAEHRASLEKITAATRDGTAANAECERLKTSASLILKVPCGGMNELKQACPLLASARADEALLPKQLDLLVDYRQIYRELKNKADAEAAALEATKSAPTEVARAQVSLRAAQADILRIRELIATLSLFEAAALALTEAQERRSQLLVRKGDLETEIAAMSAAHTVAVAEMTSRDAALRDRIVTRRTAVMERLAGKQRIDVRQALQTLETSDTQLRSKLDQSSRERDALHSDIATTEALISERESALHNAQARTQQLGLIDTKIAHYKLVQAAFGNDGIVSLIIDEAGPEISDYANDLLRACFGGRFSIEIRTQIEAAVGLKEGFEIIVIDSRDGSSKPVDVMSGGERVWINECLVRSIALFLSQRGGYVFETLFSDETDGPLDPERKAQFVAMKRRVLELGGYHREFFVTQSQDLWEQADARLYTESLAALAA